MTASNRRPLEIIAVILSLLAIAFAIIQFWDSRELKRRIQDLIAEASTRYIGLFPDDIDDINRTIVRTQREVRVLADYPGYAHYSQPRKYLEYENDILQLRRSTPPKRVRMLFYSAAIQRASLEDQFKRENWQQIQRSDTFKEFFGTAHTEVETPKTYDQFLYSLLQLQKRYEKTFCNNGVEIEHIVSPSVLFFWLRDEDTAVFSINSRDEKEREQSFYTSDGKLTHSFTSIFDRFWKDSESDQDACNTGNASPASGLRQLREHGEYLSGNGHSPIKAPTRDALAPAQHSQVHTRLRLLHNPGSVLR